MRKPDIFQEQVAIAICCSIPIFYQANCVTELESDYKLHIINKELRDGVGKIYINIVTYDLRGFFVIVNKFKSKILNIKEAAT